MKTLIFFSFPFLHFISSVNTCKWSAKTNSQSTQDLDKDNFALVCPKGLLVEGISWYYKPRENVSNESFSICVNCKPEKEGNYQWIEICFANSENPLRLSFGWHTLSCENKPFNGTHQILQKICQENKTVCGITVKTGTSMLDQVLRSVQSIPCKNIVTNPYVNTLIITNTANYDVDLVCPENSTLFGFERFYLPDSGGKIRVLSALCKLNENINSCLSIIHAKGKLNDTRIMDLFYKNYSGPINSVNGNGTRCILLESSSNIFSLRWHSTTCENTKIEYVNCSKIYAKEPTANVSVPPTLASTTLLDLSSTTPHISEYSSQVSATSTFVSTTSSQVSAPAATLVSASTSQVFSKESNQNNNYIIGTCCALFILLIIVIISCLIRVKKLKRDDGNRKKDEYEIDTISKNPYYESEQLGGENLLNNNPYYEVNNIEIAEMSRNPYYGTDEEGTSAGSVVLLHQNPYYD